MANKTFPKGVIAFPPHAKAPDFVVASVVITPRQLVDWLKAEGKDSLTDYNGEKQLKLQITRNREGKFVTAVDDFKPTQQNNFTTNKKEETGDNLPF